jgi:hypothetical protein
MGALILFARDPGSANQVLALAELLQSPDSASGPDAACLAQLRNAHPPGDVVFAATGVGYNLLHNTGQAVADWTTDIADRGLSAALRRHRADTVVTGFSDRDDRSPQKLWRAARAVGARSIAMIDDTAITLDEVRADLVERFCDDDGSLTWPDQTWTIDAASRDAVVAAGAAATTVHVVGHLHLARFRMLAADVTKQQISALRETWSARPEEQVVLFASQPLTEMAAYGKRRSYNELSALDTLVAQIVSGGKLAGLQAAAHETLIVVRPHPRDDDRKFAGRQRDAAPRLRISKAGTSIECVLAADVIAGLNSMLLVEAASVGRPTFSLIDFDPYSAATIGGT